MPLKFESLVTLWQQYQIYFILSFVLVGLTLIAVVTTVIALRKARRLKTPATNTAPQGKSHLAPSEKKTQNENATPHGIKRTKLAVGDVANPWTQAVYERHSPEGKIDALLPPFAFDEHGGIHRLAFPDAVKGIDIERALQYTDTAAGLAVNGAYAVFLLWHAGDARYAAYALKVASHAQIAPEQKNLVRFLFQDVIEKRVSIFDVPGIERWSKPAFRAAVTLYTAPKISEERGGELEKVLPTALSRFYELTLAQKLPIKIIYRKAATNPIFAEGLYHVNLKTLRRWMNPVRWLRIHHSGNAARLAKWVSEIACETPHDALFHIANPAVFAKEDLPESLAERIDAVLSATNTRAWLFEEGKLPPLIERMNYFKYFCLFERYSDGVRCFAFLGIFRHSRNFRLFYARALFMSGMLHDAWAEIASLLEKYPSDRALLNEAGIYAHKMTRYDEASEIFARARSLYPDDATLAYNEAVFTEDFSRVQVAEKWSRVEKLNSWAEPERIIPPPVVD